MWLDAATKSLEVVLGGAITTNQLPWTVSYGEVATDNSTSASKGGDGATNSTTAVTIVAAPGASLVRELRSFSIQNADTVSATVIVQLNNNATLRTIIKVTLATGEMLCYDAGRGWYCLNTSGKTKVA